MLLPSPRLPSRVSVALLAVVLALLAPTQSQVLTPSQILISHRKPIHSSATCGEINGQPIREIYCSLTGSSQYTPLSSYSYKDEPDSPNFDALQEARSPRELFIQGGHGCGVCEANTVNAHPASNMVDGNNSWWMSPPLARGLQYNQINITIDLEQEFHVAYVWIQMANTPRPGSWVLERSKDYGKTYEPWFYFAENSAECMRRFGAESLAPIADDTSVICRTDMSSLQPLENAEMVVRVLEHRPSSEKFGSSEALQNFTRATNVRIRLLGTRTLRGHLMDMNESKDPSVTRRYFYAIKEIMMGGRCVCNGHAGTCDILDQRRPRAFLCRCEHNTCGDMCEMCCPGFVQKKWEPATAKNNFTCEPCNCFGRSNECVYDEELEKNKQSLDIHGNYEGGGRCLNCRFNTEGINCNKCSFGYYRPEGVQWNETMPCKRCQCDPSKHTDGCAESTGKCECQPRFEGEDCDRCAKGYYGPPECKPCDCNVNGTEGEMCQPEDGQCPCKTGFGGIFCETCSPGYTNVTAGCHECVCDEQGSENKNCSATTSQCTCKEGFSGLSCNECKTGFYGFPNCTFCNCDPLGTEGGMCDATTGQCLCKEGFAGDKCDHCDIGYYSYPHCKPCGCDGAGTNSPECNTITGQCQCSANFTGRICDKCAAGFYDYPNCRECSCLIEGAKGQTCDAKGQCYCKDNFDGERCERCKPNFYNYPACEECNCNPNGVTQNFGGCDKVAPGELCECRKNVIGRICDTCKPTTWNLQYYHTDGCVDCMCNLNGTISGLNICNQKSGQCVCKRYASGRKCDQCAEGYYNLQGYNQMGCQPCNCDAGGSLRTSECDMETGQCKCRPRVSGARCDKPIENHYYPTLHQYLYEAEDGHTETNRPVRYAVNASQFPNFSWRGYAVFSPIQEHVILDVDIPKASVYRLLYKYKNPTPVTISATVTASPLISHSQPDSVQTTKVSFPTGDQPAIKEITIDDKPFVLNPGKWAIRTSTKQRLFLDYIVLLPSEYYEATLLRQPTPPPCLANASTTTGLPCLDLLYPPLPSPVRADEADGEKVFNYVDSDGTTTPLEKVPVEILPEIIGSASYVQTSNDSRIIETKLFVPEDGEYAILIEYHNLEEKEQKTTVEVQQDGEVAINGSLRIRHCPFGTFCRSVATDMGNVAFAKLKEGKATVQIRVLPNHQFGLASVNLIKKSEFSEQYLKQVPVCLRKNQKCIPQSYPPAPDSVTADAKTSAPAKAITGDKLPFPVAHPEQVAVVSLDEGQGTVEISGVVPSRGHYMFLVHYYNHDNTALDVDVLLQNDQVYEATVPLAYCPSIMGCRALIRMKERPEVIQFWVENKYTATLRHNESQKGPIYIDSITAIPYHSYSERLMTPLAMDQSRDFIEQCSGMHFENHPKNVSDFCKDKIFSLTTDFNSAALSCDCVAQGSESFSCNEYGGQCSCKPNIIGRRCDRCASGYYNFPQCLKCQCSAGQQCDPTNGQCFCPPHVEGTNCNKCVSNAFGYDPLIGCQKCDCHPQGSEGASMVCDAETGQCLCRPSVGGRSCDQCLPGYYGFPHCYQCRCQTSGTRESICDPATATCQCKENVYGPQCDTCKPGTFDLSNDNPLGCVNCFCFGVTESCRSSNLPISISSVDMSAFLTTDDHGAVDIKDDQVVYTADANSPASVYFVVPINVGADHTTSYGLLLTFKMSVEPKSEQQKNANTDADVRIRGRNMTAEFWASEQPVDFQKEFTVKARLNPENWQTPEGKALTRKDLMMILQSLQSIHLKASYYDNPKSAKLVEFGLEVANEQPNRYASSLLAASVEQCQCPAPYTGLSCQLCAPGYYRVQSGSMLGACVPCDCNGHSGTCDPDTGICSMCEHNTYGDHCEFCSEGHYGDAKTGSPYACLPCQCPYAPDNNFATSCVATEYGDMQSCSCKEGYSGDRCERCDTGYYGEPQQVGGSCKQCDCNSNNNLTDPRSCHPISGDCYQCEYNTQGRHCEYCAPWFHGDAIAAKNCTSCTCDQCGSAQCDNKSGKCVCKPNVEGDDCERCAPNHFGYSRCEGCRPCHCGVAASIGQCDDNGQCTCRPGAAGIRCEHCEHGYWNYGENGCEKCDCEADLSLGTVCDVRTGQCHCQEGATGPRCDECLKSYLRIPTLGCRRCDECVHSLIADVDTLQLQIEVLNTSIGNISSATVVGARLSRNKKRLQEYADLSELLTNSDDNMLGDTRHILNNRTSIVNIANRYVDNLEEARSKSENLTQKTMDLKREIDRKSGEATREIDATARLAAAIGEHASALRFDQRQITDAEETLRNLEAATADPKNPKIDESPQKIAESIKKINDKTDKIKEQKDKLEKSKQKQVDALKYIGDAEKQLKDAKNKAEKATQKAKSLNLAKIEGLNDAVGDEIEKFDEEKKSIADKNIELRNATEVLKDATEGIQTSLATLNETRSEFDAELEKRKEKREKRQTSPSELNDIREKSIKLQQQATELEQTFGSAKRDSSQGVDAANAYGEIVETLRNASNVAEQAVSTVEGQQDGVKEMKEKLGNINKESEEKRNKLKDVRVSLETLEHEASKAAKNVQRISEQVDKIRKASERAKSGMVTGLEDKSVMDKIKEAEEKVEAARAETEESKKESEAKRKELEEKTQNIVDNTTDAIQGIKTTKANLKQLQSTLPGLVESMKSVFTSNKQKNDKVEKIQEKVDQIKEMIAVARDAANRIKLGAHFERGSSLDLNMPSRVSRYAAHTDISFYIKTAEEHGIPLFFGNQEGSSGTRAVPTDDYIAVELEYGKPKVTVDLGEVPLVVRLNTNIADNQWRRLRVERIGKTVTVSVTKPNSEEVEESATAQATGNKSVLNLHQTHSKLFIGGVAPNTKISSDVRNRDFVGDIEDVQLHGEPVGLWNAQQAGARKATGARKRERLPDAAVDTSISLTGDGYAAYKTGYKRLQKKTMVSLSFLTFAPDGQLLFIGKDTDFISIELSQGVAKLSVELGSGVGQWTTESAWNDGKWHTMILKREEKHVKMEIDGEVVEGDTPGSMVDLSVGDVFYVGGTPSGISRRDVVEPFRGCMKSVKIESDEIDLHSSVASKGVRNTCAMGTLSTISLLSERSSAIFRNVSATGSAVQVTLKFKTRQPKGTLFTIGTDEEETFTLKLQDDKLIAQAGDDKVSVDVPSAADEQWHYVSVIKQKDFMRVDVDDLFSNEMARKNGDEAGEESTTNVWFGKHDADSFVGCLGDVTYNGKLLDFAKAEHKEVSLSGCGLSDDTVVTTEKPTDADEDDDSSTEEAAGGHGNGKPDPDAKPLPTEAPIVLKKDGTCALPVSPIGEFVDSDGYRFGMQPNSRLEYSQMPDSFDRAGTFTLQLRATATLGVVFFATNDKHTDHIGLFISNGKLIFSFSAGNAITTVKSDKMIVDGQWHKVKCFRGDGVAELTVDDEPNEVQVQGADDTVDTQPPFYVGGIPNDLASKARTIVQGVKAEFSGCIRNLQLNDKEFVDAKEVGSGKCSSFTENGIYFGENGGYAVLDKEFTVGESFSADLEVRPRTNNGILLSVGVLEYLTVQFVNGKIFFTIDAGSGPDSVNYTLPEPASFCDGHWHSVKIMKKKSLMTLTVDGKTGLIVNKKGGKKDILTKDPLYLGGVPEGVTNEGLQTRANYVGCIRVLSIGQKKDKEKVRRQLEISTIDSHGDVNKQECPVN